jgi:hypothetical protein
MLQAVRGMLHGPPGGFFIRSRMHGEDVNVSLLFSFILAATILFAVGILFW